MSGDLNKLYSDTIRAHAEKPYHFKTTAMGTHLKAYNPVCGDRFDWSVACDRDQVKELFFHGFGCAVSKASSSILAATLEGTSREKAIQLCDAFIAFLDQKLPDPKVLPVDCQAFSAVWDFPERYDCAALPWMEMKKYLKTQS